MSHYKWTSRAGLGFNLWALFEPIESTRVNSFSEHSQSQFLWDLPAGQTWFPVGVTEGNGHLFWWFSLGQDTCTSTEKQQTMEYDKIQLRQSFHTTRDIRQAQEPGTFERNSQPQPEQIYCRISHCKTETLCPFILWIYSSLLQLLPGQPPLVQFLFSLSGPSCEQSLPPGLGAGLVQERLRLWRPSPQVTEHWDQPPHAE